MYSLQGGGFREAFCCLILPVTNVFQTGDSEKDGCVDRNVGREDVPADGSRRLQGSDR